MKILVADDDEVVRLALRSLLTQHGWEVVTASNGEEAYALLQQDDAPLLALVDWMMPGMSGVELCRKVRASDKSRRTHMIMLTGRREKDDMVTGLESGADDFISKPFNINELNARVRAAERSVSQLERLRIRANVDELTGVLSRAGISEILQHALDDAVRNGGALSIIIGDADRFKEVNDRHGHPVGDSVLQELAERLRAPLRQQDSIGRFGGEEFLAVLPGCALQDAVTVAERVRLNVCATPLETTAGMLCVTVSLGVASSTGAAAADRQRLLEDADKALYRAKQGGRNRIDY
jgi:diguanylate cyclase (GGDEF)-like protein